MGEGAEDGRQHSGIFEEGEEEEAEHRREAEEEEGAEHRREAEEEEGAVDRRRHRGLEGEGEEGAGDRKLAKGVSMPTRSIPWEEEGVGVEDRRS